MHYFTRFIRYSLICSISLCLAYTDRASYKNSQDTPDSNHAVEYYQSQQEAIKQDIASSQTHKELSQTSHNASRPTHPLEAVSQTKEPPVDTNIGFIKPRDMSLEQAYTARIYYLWKQQIDPAIHVIERILILEEDQSLRAQHMIEIGDLYMSKQDYPHAQAVYDTFVQLYPGSQYLEYVLYQALLCHYYSIISPDKDQTATYNMIEAAENYLTSYGESGLYSREVRQSREYGYTHLCKAELTTFDFYVNKYTYTTNASSLRAAYYRLQHIYDHISPHMPSQKSHKVRTIIARAIRAISIDTLEEAQEDHKNQIYQQLCNTRQELESAINDDGYKSWWDMNPLHRF